MKSNLISEKDFPGLKARMSILKYFVVALFPNILGRYNEDLHEKRGIEKQSERQLA